jgi:hypothetical protein
MISTENYAIGLQSNYDIQLVANYVIKLVVNYDMRLIANYGIRLVANYATGQEMFFILSRVMHEKGINRSFDSIFELWKWYQIMFLSHLK